MAEIFSLVKDVIAVNETTKRLRLKVKGVVQGVGFRPHVYACAMRSGVNGFVGNESSGVFIEVEGDENALNKFQHELKHNPPPLSHIEEICAEEIEVENSKTFVIVESEAYPNANTLISPDISICKDCLTELFDPANRRYRYPFTNCTNCGPRFTIIKDIPYDRPFTTMAGFHMCAECESEYHNPLDRRFHAQPNACPVCGPKVESWLSGSKAVEEDAIRLTQEFLLEGKIVAVKGIGGFHLACDAMNDNALQLLRERKGRVGKPFAVMARDLEIVKQLAFVNDEEQRLLESKERPIVLLKKRAGNKLSEFIAPGNDYIGVMLPYSPLHYVLLTSEDETTEALKVLVMTSGNYSNEPIVKDNEEALEKLSSLADAFLLHDREIHVQCDDSVIRVFENKELPVRRSRGYAPFPVKLPFNLPPTLAAGGELKSTFCMIKDDHAFMSQHIGDMENLETLNSFAHSVEHFRILFRVEPEIVAGDMHPRYMSSNWARENLSRLASESATYKAVQHHHAHIAAVMAENGLDGKTKVIGFSFDGTGFGTDGAIWGGEVLLSDYKEFKRAAHLAYVPLPGGDAAIKRPYRIALTHLWAAGVDWNEALPCVEACAQVERGVLLKQLENKINTIPTSSMGRLFDAVASLIGVRQIVTYEAQAAIEMEALTDLDERGSYKFELEESESVTQIIAAPLIKEIARDVSNKVSVSIISAKFHNAVADVILELSVLLRDKFNLNQVGLSGGVFQNVTLLEKTKRRLQQAGFEVFTHSKVPPNDGGLALGQAIIANFNK